MIADHKTIEAIRTKIIFDLAQVKRWFDWLKKINYEVQYRKEKEIIVMNAPSKAVEVNAININIPRQE